MDSIRLEIGYDFVPLAKKEVPNLISEIAALRGRLESEDQLLLPAVRVRDSVDLAGLEFRIFTSRNRPGERPTATPRRCRRRCQLSRRVYSSIEVSWRPDIVVSCASNR